MSYQKVQLSDLLTLLQGRFDNPSFWTTYSQTAALNEALSIFQIATGRWRQRYIVTTVANRVFYSIPTLSQLQINGVCQVIAPIRVAFNGVPMGWTSISDMDCTYPGWQADTTITPGAPPQPVMCGPAGLNYLWIYPADAAGNGALQLDCLNNAPQLVNPDDYVDLDETEITALLDYGQHRLSLDRGGIFFARTLPLLQNFLRVLADRNSYLMNISIFRQMTGTDYARNFAPRRASERSGRPVGVGLR